MGDVGQRESRIDPALERRRYTEEVLLERDLARAARTVERCTFFVRCRTQRHTLAAACELSGTIEAVASEGEQR